MEENDPIVRKFQKELNSGAVALVSLAVLEQAGGPLYGYGIARQLEDRAGGPPLVKQGTLYPVLRTLEGQGLLASEVEPSVAGPPRRYYRLTAAGRETLAAWRAAWTRTRDFVDHVLTEPAPTPADTAGAA